MFQLIYNIANAFLFSIWSLLLTIITGKMAKISPYHFVEKPDDNNGFNICNDRFIKTNLASNVSNEAKHKIISDYINSLSQDESVHGPLTDADWPIFNGKERIGTGNYFSTMKTALDNYIKNL